MISINPFSRDGYDNASIWIGGCIGFFGLLLGGLIIHGTKELNKELWIKLHKSVKLRKF
ncbi:hypothetical protein DIGNKC_210 [Bacillus phage DIGNKC]|uniref:hypothetical protein n=1 Tax=Bacillus phage DIGNKC TaxID=1805948 RepID=UPI0007A76E31|nr:hypothetical protein BI007_gp164 [Bacillus phage DIGNKC]AMW62821.1 hypothetical protein DIGNKC_210 [Bacillus phage DIGNKC]AOZ62462.1 hypothetical protein SBP8a_212 [Bacillus phage SBP8a]UGO46460.1 hypothetical protein ABINADI_143 [Bacillus phage vB_BanH_Abinadi]